MCSAPKDPGTGGYSWTPLWQVPLRIGLGYAIGDLGISLAYFAVGFFFLFYLTDVVGLSASLAGVVVLIGKIWDGVNDPLIGIMSDRTRSARGRKRVYLLYGAIPFAISFVLLWWIPAGWERRRLSPSPSPCCCCSPRRTPWSVSPTRRWSR